MIDHVIWPPKYDPKISALYALNDSDMKAPPETVWQLLVEAENWHSYFAPENQVKILDGGSELRLGTKFTRVTVGIPCNLVVEEYEPGRRIAWSMQVEGHEDSGAYHGWVITPTDDGCYVVSEETQQGPFMIQKLGVEMPGGLFKYHQQWVEDLARAAEARVATGA